MNAPLTRLAGAALLLASGLPLAAQPAEADTILAQYTVNGYATVAADWTPMIIWGADDTEAPWSSTGVETHALFEHLQFGNLAEGGSYFVRSDADDADYSSFVRLLSGDPGTYFIDEVGAMKAARTEVPNPDASTLWGVEVVDAGFDGSYRGYFYNNGGYVSTNLTGSFYGYFGIPWGPFAEHGYYYDDGSGGGGNPLDPSSIGAIELRMDALSQGTDGSYTYAYTILVHEAVPVPEPASLALAGIGVAAVAARPRGRRRPA